MSPVVLTLLLLLLLLLFGGICWFFIIHPMQILSGQHRLNEQETTEEQRESVPHFLFLTLEGSTPQERRVVRITLPLFLVYHLWFRRYWDEGHGLPQDMVQDFLFLLTHHWPWHWRQGMREITEHERYVHKLIEEDKERQAGRLVDAHQVTPLPPPIPLPLDQEQPFGTPNWNMAELEKARGEKEQQEYIRALHALIGVLFIAYGKEGHTIARERYRKYYTDSEWYYLIGSELDGEKRKRGLLRRAGVVVTIQEGGTLAKTVINLSCQSESHAFTLAMQQLRQEREEAVKASRPGHTPGQMIPFVDEDEDEDEGDEEKREEYPSWTYPLS